MFQTKYSKTKKYDDPLYKNPMSVEELFSVKGIDPSGIFVLPDNMYSKSYVLSDINFKGVTDSEQKTLILNFSKVLNSIPCRFSYTMANEYIDGATLNKRLLYDKNDDRLDDLRDAFNEFISSKVSAAKQGLYQTIYLTLTVNADSLLDAKDAFNDIETSLSSAFIELGVDGIAGSVMTPIDINTRMQTLYNFTHSGIKSKYKFDFDKCYESFQDWIDIVSPESIEFYNDYFVMNGNRYGQVLYISHHAPTLDSNTMSALANINATNYISINSELLDLAGFKQELNRKFSKVGMSIEAQKQRNRNRNDYLSDASDKLLSDKEKLVTLTEDVEEAEEHYFNTTVLIMFLAKDLAEMNEIKAKIKSILDIKSSDIKPCFNMQREGINSAFMFGIQEFKRVTNLSASCEAMYIPFRTQDLNDENGTFCGINRINHNPIIADRKLCSPFHGMVLGMTRHGKSLFVKLQILNDLFVNPDDQVLIIDPQNEYKKIAYMKGVDGIVISFDTSKNVFVNPLDCNFEGVDYSGLQDIISVKTDFILTLLASCMRRDINAAEQGVLDKVISKIYSENYARRRKLNGETEKITEYSVPGYMQTEDYVLPIKTDMSPQEQERVYSPILQDIYQELVDMKDNDIAQNLAGYMQIFVNGSLNLFNHKTNVDLDNKFIVFDLSGIKKNLKITSTLVMLEIIRNKIKWNFSKNNLTKVYIDEFHELLNIPAVADYVIKLWKEVAKLKGGITGITQNMTDLLNNSPDSAKLAAILSNTEYFALLCQSSIDRKMLMDFLPSVSPAMFNFVENAPQGMGLLKVGPVIVPFDITMEKSCRLYKYINTDGNDGIGAM